MAKKKSTTKTKSKAKKKATKKVEIARPPIVAVLGHVDHGKTTLLDAIRGTDVFGTEAGGITQNTRAHQITTAAGNKITFVDTPGHEAFSQMRARGAEVTDFVLLVVAADDGVQPQTIESINFAKEAGVPIIVAINKIDLPVKSLDKLKSQLSDHGVVIEEYGGEAMCFEVSAIKQKGLKELIEGIELLSEISELRLGELQHDGSVAEAYVLESQVDKRLGAVALCILKAGKLAGREMSVNGDQITRVRAYLDEYQKPLKQVGESDPFWVSGLKGALDTGAILYFAADQKSARKLVAELQATAASDEEQTEEVVDDAELSAQELIARMIAQKEEEEEGVEQKELTVIVRSSTKGTLEAVLAELGKLNDDDAAVKVVDAAVGSVSESDLHHAKATGSIVLSFQMEMSKHLQDLAKQERVLVRNYDIIYDMVDEVGAALDGMLEPEETEVPVARAKVKKVFTLTNGDIVAGCEVSQGTITRGYSVWVERGEDNEVGRGKITSLKHFKEEVKEVKKGLECGIVLSPAVEDIQEGDDVVAYKVEKN